MILEWYHWAIAGVVLMVAELLVPAFVLVWFGLGALIVALALALVPGMELIPQLLIWIAVSLFLVVLWFKVFKPARHKILTGRSSAEAIGQIGLLVDDIDQFKKSRVRFQKPLIGSDVWDCIADEAIKAGSRVRVVNVEGSLLKITTTEEGS